MPSTYTTSLSLTLPATGELSGAWGTTVNSGVTSLVDDSVAGTTTITMVAADYTLTITQGATNEARRMFLTLTGTPGAARNVIVPAVSKLYFVFNNTTGGFAQTVKTSAGTGISVPNGARVVLYCDGINVVDATNTFNGVTLNGTTIFGGSVTPATNTVDSVGYTGTPVNSQSAAYQLVAADAGKSIVHPITDNNARTFTIPANGTVPFPVGTTVTFINMTNTVTIAITTDTMYLAGVGTTGSRTLAAFGMATAVKVTSTSWIISGNNLT